MEKKTMHHAAIISVKGRITKVKKNYEDGTRKHMDPYEVTFHDRQGYLHVLLTGRTENLDAGRKVWEKIEDQCRKRGCKNVLLEKDLTEDMHVVDIYNLMRELDSPGARMICVAIVDRRNNRTELNEFAATVAGNRGFTHRFFTTIDEAEKWLLPKTG